jgi:hypothetical protein
MWIYKSCKAGKGPADMFVVLLHNSGSLGPASNEGELREGFDIPAVLYYQEDFSSNSCWCSC